MGISLGENVLEKDVSQIIICKRRKSMDQKKILPFEKFNLDDITIWDYSDEEMKSFIFYVDITNSMEEVHQVFEIFQYNMERLLSVYKLNRNDRIERITPNFRKFNDNTEINALVINLISSGKSLLEAMKLCVQSCYSKESDMDRQFREVLSHEYDNCFSYCFLLRLRDFSQHGHVPVSIDGEKICFDISQLVNTLHFNFNKAILGQMQEFCDELLLKEKVQAHYVFSMAIAEFSVSVFKIYCEYWNVMQEIFYKSLKNISELIQRYPAAIKHRNKKFDNYIFYLIENNLHTFNTSENSEEMYLQYLKEAEVIKKSQEKELKKFRGNIKSIPKDDKVE